MNLKLYRIRTVLRYIPTSWENATQLSQSISKNRVSIFFELLFWFYFYGNDFNDYCTFKFWNKSFKQRKSYISRRRNEKLGFKLSSPRVYNIMLDKAEFNHRYNNYINRAWLDCRSATKEQVSSFIASHEYIIAKPLTDYGGHGVRKLHRDNCPSPSDFSHSNFILEECITNIPSIQCIAPGSLNTVRIVTFIDRDGNISILAALLRMGNGHSFTDNYHDGGMATPIDITTGKMMGNAFGMNLKEYATHPMSGIAFDGYFVEEFDKCLELVYEVAKCEPEARYVGWDFAITPNGIELLEGNIPPGEDITQIAAGRGLWYDVTNAI